MQSSLRDGYESLLWKTMDILGVTESVERKILVAVGIQFSVSIGMFLAPLVVSGTTLLVTQGGLFFAAGVAFVNTTLIARRDLVTPLDRIAAAMDSMARGHVDTDPIETSQRDEVGALAQSFNGLQSYLRTVGGQADALAEQSFDDPVLEEPVPGPFGESITTMAERLEAHTTELKARSERLEGLVAAFESSTAAAGDGDLTATIEADLGDDETYRQVIDGYNELLGRLGGSIGDASRFGRTVAASADDVADRVGELDRAGTEIATATDDIAAGAETQRNRLESVSSEVNTLSATVEEIAATADATSDTATTANEIARTGQSEATETLADLSAIESGIEDVSASVEALSERIDEVDEIVALIEEIAEETNLLALNASIEAARADGGDGFAVVADEIKSLAEEARESAEEIATLLSEIQRRSDESVSEVQTTKDSVAESIDSVESSLERFDELAAVVTDVTNSVHEISDATDQQARSAEDVATLVEEVTEISYSTADDAEAAAAAAEEQTTALSGVAKTVEELSAGATELATMLERYETPEADGNAAVEATVSVPTAD